jgi:uncharacterized caspase-like protein
VRIRLRFVLVTAFAALLLAVSSSVAFADRRVALVVGNSHYAALGTLGNPTNDADDIAATLRGMGFAVTEVVDANEQQFTDQLSNFSTAATGADVALFYYSGHGLQYKSENYLVPVDATLGNRFALEHGTISLNDVLTAMQDAHTALIYIDACRSFPIAGTFLASPNERIAPIAGLAPVQNVPNTFIGFSASAGQTAQDGSGRNSPFTTAMLEELPKPGLDVTQMFNSVSAQVVASTSGAQKPESFNGVAATVALVAGGADTQASAGASDEEERAYLAAATVGTAGAYRAYISRFPGGYYNELAREALSKLEASSVPPAPRPTTSIDESGPINLAATSDASVQQLMPQIMNGRPVSGLPNGLKEASFQAFGPTRETIGAWSIATSGDHCTMYTEARGLMPPGWLSYRPWLDFGTSTGSRLVTSAMFTTYKPDGSDFIKPGTTSAIITRSDGVVRKIAAVFNNTELAMLSPCVNASDGAFCLDTDALQQMSSGVWLNVVGIAPSGANVAITYDVRGYADAARRIGELCKANIGFLYGAPNAPIATPAPSAKQ